LTDLKILLQAVSAVYLQQILVENVIIPQIPSCSALWFTVHHSTCFKLLLVFWH